MKSSRKFVTIVCFGVIYLVSLLLFSIGYFTPKWVLNQERVRSVVSWFWQIEDCDTAGLISGQCRYPYNDLSKSGWHLGLILRLCFYLMLAAAVFLYTNFLILMGAVFLKMYKYEVYMSFLAISFGVFYPIAGIFTLFCSTAVISTYGRNSGLSAICSLIAGFLMLVCYTGLRIYDHMYSKSVAKRQKTYR